MPDSNIRSLGYFIARARVPCRHCDRFTPTLALAVPPTHELLEVNSDNEAESQCTWLPAGVPAFLFFVTWLPDAVLCRLSAYSDEYRLDSSLDPSNFHWLNHCEHCGTPQHDEDLHCEPGVFMPIDESEAANIEWVYVNEAFEAAAAGYAPDPEFLAWPPTSSI
jgi:hypothetical protein